MLRIAAIGSLAYRLGVLGAALGVLAGIVQAAFGGQIPDWTGDKLHPVHSASSRFCSA